MNLLFFCSLPSGWPNAGAIQFKNVSLRYRQGRMIKIEHGVNIKSGLDCVLHDLTFEIKPQEKIGIVGRTGRRLYII